MRAAELLDEAEKLSLAVQDYVDGVEDHYRDPQLQRLWRQSAHETIRWSERERALALIIDKYHRKARLYHDGNVIDEFHVDLGWNGPLD